MQLKHTVSTEVLLLTILSRKWPVNRNPAKSIVFADSDNGGIIHIANIKGGVGKSTVATNLSAALAKRGKTLVVDFDVQGSATHALGFDPSTSRVTSWELFRGRYEYPGKFSETNNPLLYRIGSFFKKIESMLFPQIVGKGDITSLAVNVAPGLDLIPATSDLFKNTRFYHLQNLIHNLHLCRHYYKYIIIDTPSVWNRLTRLLYIQSDLNLIPVTLNALSTRSLRDYLRNVKRLTHKKPSVRIRIVKNEVFGREGSKIKGKTRTMQENRLFLDTLCEQVVIDCEHGVSLLPQSIIFDLEIPESATVRDAQDAGQSVHQFHQYSAAAKAFDELGKRIQYVLNNPRIKLPRYAQQFHHSIPAIAARLSVIVILIVIFLHTDPVLPFGVPRPIAPQQLQITEDEAVTRTLDDGESITKMAKYAICHFCAVVPGNEQINEYLFETINIHNMTRMPGEVKISANLTIPAGTKVTFYPPLNINNPKAKRLIPVYTYFMSLVEDTFAYVTGDWCERGTGGGTPHYGLDIAAALGTVIRSPVEGIALLNNSQSAGRMVGIVQDGTVFFFAHMDKRFVADGERVSKGTALGTVGMTGKTSGPHAHMGYGLVSPSAAGLAFGKRYYRLTDPKLFFYREQYLN